MEGNTTAEKSEYRWPNMLDQNHHVEEAGRGRDRGQGQEVEGEDQPPVEAGRGQGALRDLGGIVGARAAPRGLDQDQAPKVVHETEARKRSTVEARVGPDQDKVAQNLNLNLKKMILKKIASLDKTAGPGPSQSPDPDRNVSPED
jgi:hypothetical protein